MSPMKTIGNSKLNWLPMPPVAPDACAFASEMKKLNRDAMSVRYSPKRSRRVAAADYYGTGPGSRLPVASNRRLRVGDAPSELHERAGLDRRAQPPHQIEIKMQVVLSRQPGAEDLVALLQMAQVRARIVPARVARTGGIDRPGVALEARVAD